MTGHELLPKIMPFPPFLSFLYSEAHRGLDISGIYPEFIRIKQIMNGTGTEITDSNIRIIFCFGFSDYVSVFEHINISSPNSKLIKLRNCIGLNITELANILSVKRPTIYEWLEKDGNPSVKNKKRLDKLYSLLDPLISQNASEFKKYLHNEMPSGEKLYDLLINTNLNTSRISILVQNILDDILLKRQKATTHEKILQSKGFKPVGKDQKNKALDKLIRKIG